MGNAKQDAEREDQELQKRPDWQRQRDAQRDAKAPVNQPPKGLRSQGAVGIVPASAPEAPKEGMGRRQAPTRHDAMEIAGHERLPGYETPVTEDAAPSVAAKGAPKVAARIAKEAPEIEPMAKPEVPDLKDVALDADRELKHSSDDAEVERLEEKDEELEAEPVGEQKERDAKALDKGASEAEEAKA